MIEKIKQWAASNPKLAQWIREGGLFILVSNVITIGKTIALMFLPAAFAWLGTQSCGFPGIEVELFGINFTWNIIGYSSAQGGAAYFAAYMVAMFVGEVVNFFIQRGWAVERTFCDSSREERWAGLKHLSIDERKCSFQHH